MENRLTKPDSDDSKSRVFWQEMHRNLSVYFWRCKESKLLLIFVLLWQNLNILCFFFDLEVAAIWQGDELLVHPITNAIEFFNLQRYLVRGKPQSLITLFYVIFALVVLMNMFFLPSLFFKLPRVVEQLNRQVIG